MIMVCCLGENQQNPNHPQIKVRETSAFVINSLRFNLLFVPLIEKLMRSRMLCDNLSINIARRTILDSTRENTFQRTH